MFPIRAGYRENVTQGSRCFSAEHFLHDAQHSNLTVLFEGGGSPSELGIVVVHGINKNQNLLGLVGVPGSKKKGLGVAEFKAEKAFADPVNVRGSCREHKRSS